MSVFRPTVAPATAPQRGLLRRWAPFGAAATLIALLALALLREGTPRAVAGAPVSSVAERSAWDDAIASLVDDRPPSSSERSDDMPGRPALTALALKPHVVNGEVAGYAIRSAELPQAFADAGLKSGDVLTTIDGLPLDADRARRLGDEFGGLDDVEVTYHRNGELREALIVFRAR